MSIRNWLFRQGSSQEDNRLGLAALFGGAAGLTVRSGALPDAGLLGATVSATSPAPSSSVAIHAGHIVLQGVGATEGVYLLPVPADTIDVLTANPPESLQRYDIIAARIDDASYPAGTLAPTWKVIKGTASSTPTDPPNPDSATYVRRARVRVKAAADYTGAPAIQPADIDSLGGWTGLRGTPIPVQDDTDRAALQAYFGLEVENFSAGDLAYSRQVTDGQGAWYQRSAQSPWKPLSFNSYDGGDVSGNGGPLRYRIDGDMVEFAGRGQLKSDSLHIATVLTGIGSIPAEATPQHTFGAITPSTGNTQIRIEISSGGVINIAADNTNARWFSLDGVRGRRFE